MSELRQEIIESEKARSEYLKWKLIIVSSLGGAGLGLTGHEKISGAYFVLALIPLVCIYVDLLCRHLSLRMMVIGAFKRLGLHDNQGGDDGTKLETAYERFSVKAERVNVYALEDLALQGSTKLISMMVILIGLAIPQMADIKQAEVFRICEASIWIGYIVQGVFALSGVVGLVLSNYILVRYTSIIDELKKLT